jgi:hypothetical protein
MAHISMPEFDAEFKSEIKKYLARKCFAESRK